MVRMAVITKTFAPDFDLCASFRSVRENSSDTIHHHIIAHGSLPPTKARWHLLLQQRVLS
jgi:hypothetical protein